jgi:hypothetical protein
VARPAQNDRALAEDRALGTPGREAPAQRQQLAVQLQHGRIAASQSSTQAAKVAASCGAVVGG